VEGLKGEGRRFNRKKGGGFKGGRRKAEGLTAKKMEGLKVEGGRF